MGTDTLYVRRESGEFAPADQDVIVDTAKAHLRTRLRRGVALTNPRAVRDFLTVNLGGRDCEYFCIVLLDARNRFLRFVELFRGTIDGAAVHPREIVKLVLQAEAGGVLLVHNHPLCFVWSVNLDREVVFGLAPSSQIVSRRPSRQGAALLTTGSLCCSPEVASRACDGRAAA